MNDKEINTEDIDEIAEENCSPDTDTETPKKDMPTYEQMVQVACGMMMATLSEANKTYDPVFNSSSEAHGVIRKQFLKLEEMLITSKIVHGSALDQYTVINNDDLKDAYIRLATMCIKGLLSNCNILPECEKASEHLRQQQVVANLMRGVDDHAEEPTI